MTLEVDRRGLLALGGAAAMLTAPARAVPAPAASASGLVFFDPALPAARAAAAAAAHGQRLVAVEGDRVRLWRGLDRAPGGPVAGYTSWSDYLLLRGLAEEEGLRVRAEERLAGGRGRRVVGWRMEQGGRGRMGRSEQEERNVALVGALYRQVLIPLDASRVDDFIAADYVQHSSLAEPGREALKAWLRARRADSPDSTQTIHQLLAEGDRVVAHVHVVRWKGDRGLAVMDMFRIADGKVAEHWDVIQELPEHPVNSVPMF